MRSSTSTSGAAVLIAAALLVTGCTVGEEAPAATPTAAVPVASPASVPPSGTARPAPPDSGASAPPDSGASAPPVRGSASAAPGGLEAALQAAVKGQGNSVSVAVAGGGRTVAANDRTVVAWSTSKVPVAIAAVRKGGVTADVRGAIVQSDNAAAEGMWASLGTAAQAGTAVDAVLTDGGDATRIETERIRAGYTPFGQTRWSDSAAAAFAARVPCIRGGRAVLDLMQQVAGNQQWGLYGTNSAPVTAIGVKGGWGPQPNGNYVVRQLAVLAAGDRYTGVMITATPADGTQATGQAQITRVAKVIAAHAEELPSNPC